MHASAHILRTVAHLVTKMAIEQLTLKEFILLNICYAHMEHESKIEHAQQKAHDLATLQKPKSKPTKQRRPKHQVPDGWRVPLIDITQDIPLINIIPHRNLIQAPVMLVLELINDHVVATTGHSRN